MRNFLILTRRRSRPVSYTHLDVYKRQPSAFDPAKKDGNLSAQIISQEQPVSETAALNPDWVEWLMGFPTGWTDVSSGPPNRKESPA